MLCSYKIHDQKSKENVHVNSASLEAMLAFTHSHLLTETKLIVLEFNTDMCIRMIL